MFATMDWPALTNAAVGTLLGPDDEWPEIPVCPYCGRVKCICSPVAEHD